MNTLKYGIKLWSINSNLYTKFIKCYEESKADYLELLYVPGKAENVQLLVNNKIPIVVHAPTFNQNVTFGGYNLEQNSRILMETLKFAEKLNAQQIIVHPDVGEKDNFIKFLRMHNNKNLVIENMPKVGINGSNCLGYNLEELKEFLDNGNFGFCLDFAHAIKSAISQKIDYKLFLRELTKLKPKIAHLSDGRLDNDMDEHLSLGDGEFDINYIVKLIKKDSIEEVTLEVPKTKGLANDIKNIGYFKKKFLA